MHVSAQAIATLLAHIFGPSFYDGPRFGGGDLVRRTLFDVVAGPRPEPWALAELNPQPLPPKISHALRLADAHIRELLELDRIGSLEGGEVGERALRRALLIVDEINGRCPFWPRWPRRWPPPPPPPWEHEKMNPAELFLLGTRFLAASEWAEHEALQKALIGLGERVVGLALPIA
jgi:hypothetical protein